MMHEPEKSDPSTVAAKPANNPEGLGAESVERREGGRGEHEQGSGCAAVGRVYTSRPTEELRNVVSIRYLKMDFKPL